MRAALIAFAAVALAGCAGNKSGILTLTVLDEKGVGVGSFNFAVVDGGGKVRWSQTPNEGYKPQMSFQGGKYTIVAIGGTKTAVQDFEVDGDTNVPLRLVTGGSLRGELRHEGKPIKARVVMPVPGRSEITDALSNIASTDADGRFRLEGLPPGNWTVIAGNEALGFKPIKVSIEAGKVTEIGITEVP